MKKQWQKAAALLQKPWGLAAVCYAAALAGWLLYGVFCLGSDGLAAVRGSLREQSMAVQDFQLVNLEQTGENTLYTLNGDPQMILPDVSGQKIRSLTIRAQYTKDAREMCLYYTTAPGQDFSQEKRVFAVQADDGTCTYTLPRTRICTLRLDPCSPAENELLTMTVESITLSAPRSALAYFAPGWAGAFNLILWPGMAAALLNIAAGLLRLLLKGRKPA